MSSSLPLVESLLNEFYQPTTSNSRKREIENELISFKNLSNSWQICLRVATTFDTNQFLWFFCTSTVEFAITRRWNQLTVTDRAALRETLWSTYANLSTSTSTSHNVPRSQRDTIAQLIAIMGKREFSDENPKYMHDCMELIKKNFRLGISLLRITSEEVVNERDGVTTERKRYFCSCMSMVMPEVMDLITKYLLIAVCHINGNDVNSIENVLVDYTLLPSLPNNSDLEASIIELLNCAQHLVSWVPTELISEYFLLSILDLSQWRNQCSEVSLSALYVLNELLYLQKTVLYAATLMNGINGLIHQHNSIKCQNEMYDDKLRELLRLYTTKYWTKLLQHNEIFEVFLKSFFCFTIAKKGALDFTEKLDAWTPIIKAMVATSKLERYCDLIHQLVAEIMRRTRFEFNKTELEILDNEVVDDNMQTEWQQYVTQCFECVALVAETRPNAVFEQVYSHWSRPYMFFMSFESCINDGKTFEIANKEKCHTFNEQLRDLSSVCQALVRIAPLLEADSAVTTDVHCHMSLLTDNLLTLLNLFSNQKLYMLYNEKTELKNDLIEMYAHVLMAIRSLLPISANLKSEQNLRHLTEIIGNIFLPCSYTNSPLVYLAASELLLCITSVIRPKFLFEIHSIVNLLQTGPRLSHLHKQVISNIYISLIGYLILPWRQVTDQQQDFQQRCTILRKYCESIAQNFLELEASYMSAQEPKVSTITIGILPILKDVVDYFKDSNNTAKEMLVTTLKPIIMKSLMIYDGCGVVNIQMSTTVADFCLSTIRTLQNQLGATFVKDVILLFITVSSREPLTSGRLIIMEKVLQMFQLVIEQPGNSSLSMLPSILDFTIGQILPTLRQNVSDKSDISYAVYKLFDSTLTCKWQYFYKSLIQQSSVMYQNENLHPEHFMAILTAYGEVLVTDNDPNIVRIVLESMQNVNEKWHLYERVLFKESLLCSFLNALLKILLSGEAALNYELIVSTLFAMGQVEKSTFRSAFTTIGGYPPNFNIEELCLSTDIPTFSQKLTQMIQDTHCTLILKAA